MRSVPALVFVSWLGLTAACAPEGSSAYVSRNVPVSSNCTPGDGDIGISTGIYDVLSSGTEKINCLRAYQMSLFINSNLKSNSQVSTGRAEPNVLLITHADVRLMDKNQAVLSFQAKDGSADAERPNPYRVHTASSIAPAAGDDPTTGVVQIQAIPAAYAEKLRGYAGDSILVEVQLFGTTTGNVDVEFRPFLYPLTICSDCLSTCANAPEWAGDRGASALLELTAESCADNRPQDGRYCIDNDC